jgi:hypothetical protein
MLKKSRTQKELSLMLASWWVDDSSLLRWKRAPRNGAVDDPVGLSAQASGHRTCSLWKDGKNITLVEANVVWFLRTREWPTFEIDHRDGNPTNNSLDNLRPATRSQNTCNTRLRSDNQFGVKGIRLTENNKYQVQIWKDGACHNVGRFNDLSAAKKARQQAEVRIHGDYARPESLL